MAKYKLRLYLPLYANFVMLSFSSVFAKFAAMHPIFSSASIALYGLAFCVLGVYVLLWQQILKRMPLTQAYLNRAITIPLGMMWGALLFGEAISPRMVLGAAIILLGVALVVKGNE